MRQPKTKMTIEGVLTVSSTPRILGPPPTYHHLRHTAAALAISQGAHPNAIQSRMGHPSITTTLNLYGHLFPSLDTELAQRLDDVRAEGLAARLRHAEPEVVVPIDAAKR